MEEEEGQEMESMERGLKSREVEIGGWWRWKVGEMGFEEGGLRSWRWGIKRQKNRRRSRNGDINGWR